MASLNLSGWWCDWGVLVPSSNQCSRMPSPRGDQEADQFQESDKHEKYELKNCLNTNGNQLFLRMTFVGSVGEI